MSRSVIFGAGFFLLLLAAAAWQIRESLHSPEILIEARTPTIQPAPLCPWRDPDADLKTLFPSATRYELQTLILSGLRLELAQRLGRAPTGDENALHVYRVYEQQTSLGTVVPQRVKGEFGSIELVLAVGTNGQVRGLRLQRLREPEAISTELQDADWMRLFSGKTADGSWKTGRDIPEVRPEAKVSAAAIVEGVRSLLILLDTADHGSLTHTAPARHH